jgi:hypothetical protein
MKIKESEKAKRRRLDAGRRSWYYFGAEGLDSIAHFTLR